MKESELKNLSVGERIEAMEALWNTFVYEATPLQSPEWHKLVLERRKARIDRGEARFMSLDELKKF